MILGETQATMYNFQKLPAWTLLGLSIERNSEKPMLIKLRVSCNNLYDGFDYSTMSLSRSLESLSCGKQFSLFRSPNPFYLVIGTTISLYISFRLCLVVKSDKLNLHNWETLKLYCGIIGIHCLYRCNPWWFMSLKI